MRKRGALAIAAGFLLVSSLAACERMSTLGFDAQSSFGSVSLGDRCVDVVRRAFPNAELDVSDPRVKLDGNAATVAVGAVRSGIPADGLYARNIAAECRFENGILMGFRWTAGPIKPASLGQAR